MFLSAKKEVQFSLPPTLSIASRELSKSFPVENPEISATEAVFPNSSCRLFRRYLGSAWLFLSLWFVRLDYPSYDIAFRKVPIVTLRNDTVPGRKCLARTRRQGFVDCFVRSEVLCGFTVGLVRLFRFLLIDNIAFRKVPIGTLRNDTVPGRKCLARTRRQGFVDCFVRSEVLCGFTVGLVRLFRFLLIDNIAFRKVPIGTLRNVTVTSAKMNLALLGR